MSNLYKNAIDKIVSASFTGDDGLDYVETLVALDALKSMERTHGEWILVHPLQMNDDFLLVLIIWMIGIIISIIFDL